MLFNLVQRCRVRVLLVPFPPLNFKGPRMRWVASLKQKDSRRRGVRQQSKSFALQNQSVEHARAELDNIITRSRERKKIQIEDLLL